MPANTMATIPDSNKTYFDTMLLRHAEPRIIHALFSEESEFPPNSGDTIEFRIFDALETVDDTLTEGVTPTPDELAVTKVQATSEQGGRIVPITDRMEYVSVDNVANETQRIQGDQAGRNIDARLRDGMNAGTSVYRPNSRATIGDVTTSDLMTYALIDKMSTALEAVNAPTFPEHGNRYVCLINPYTAYDLRQDPIWQAIIKSNTMDPEDRLASNYLGDTHNVRFFKSTVTKDFGLVGSGGCRVFSSLMMGKGYYGHAWLRPLESVYAPPVDPLKQISHLGYKYELAHLIKQDVYSVRGEHACSLKLT